MSNPRRTNKWSNSQPAPVPKPNDGAATLTRTAPSLRILLLTGLKWLMAMEWNILPHTRLPAAHQVESQFGGCAVKTTFGRHIVYTFLLLSYSHYTPPQPIIYFLHQLQLFRIVGWCSYCVCVGRISKAPGIPAVILFRIPSVFRWSPPNRNFEQETTCCSQDYSQDVQYHFRYSFHSSSSFYYFYQIYAEPQWGKNKVLMEVITSCCLFLSTHAHLARSVSSSYSRYCQ